MLRTLNVSRNPHPRSSLIRNLSDYHLFTKNMLHDFKLDSEYILYFIVLYC